jgi:ribonuclease H / adenosylcobalamin/alpha-ribazole phosphatase
MVNAEKSRLRLYLVRHGETAENARMSYLGIRDEPLNEMGLWQAFRAAEALSQFPLRLIVTSPLRRAADTAARIQEASGIELLKDARLSEGSFGQWEGLTRDEVLQLGTKDAAMLARWESDPSCAPPEGESIESLQKRVIELLVELHREYGDAEIVLVSHVGPIKALLAAVMGIPLQASRRMFLDPGTISVVEWGAHPFLRLFNSHAHLGWSSARWML